MESIRNLGLVFIFKDQVTDEKCSSILSVCNRQVSFMDISRCSHLSPNYFNLVGLGSVENCTNLLHLDLSWTAFNNCELLSSFPVLQSLNISGTSVCEIQPLFNILTLQVLYVRYCKVSNISGIENLGALRSLDIGCTLIADLSSLFGNFRMEELVMDGSGGSCSDRVILQKSVDVIAGLSNGDFCGMNSFHYQRELCGFGRRKKEENLRQNLGNLRILNVRKSQLEKFCISELQERLHPSCFNEPTTRMELFLMSIINNDAVTARRLLQNGLPLNSRLGADCDAFLRDVWCSDLCGGGDGPNAQIGVRKGGRKLGGNVPFFLCNHEVVDQRPLPIHLALFFNAFNVVQMFILCGAKIESEVWFGDVQIVSGELKQKADLNSGSPANSPSGKTRKKYVNATKSFNCIHFVQELMDKVVHRFTMRLVEKKAINWKSCCGRAKDILLGILNAPLNEIPPQLDIHTNFLQATENGQAAAAVQRSLDEQLEEVESNHTRARPMGKSAYTSAHVDVDGYIAQHQCLNWKHHDMVLKLNAPRGDKIRFPTVFEENPKYCEGFAGGVLGKKNFFLESKRVTAGEFHMEE